MSYTTIMCNTIGLWWGAGRDYYNIRITQIADVAAAVARPPVAGRLVVVSLLSAVCAPDEDVHTVTRRTLYAATAGQTVVDTTARVLQPPRTTAANVRANRGCGGGGCCAAMPPPQSAALRPILMPPPPLLLLLLLLTAAARDGLAAPDITMSIHGDLAGSGTPSTFTVNQVYTIVSNIEFRLRDLSNTLRRDQQTERINSRIDIIFNKLSHLEVSNEMWFDKFQQSVMEECGPNHMTRRLDKAQQQLEITLEHMETTLQTVQNHQKELEKEIKKVVDRQTELSTDIQTMQKDMNSEFEKHNSNQITFKKQLQDTIANLSQQSKVMDRSLSTCSCNQDSDSSQIPDITINNHKLTTTINNMYNGLKERSDHISITLKELVENTDKYRRRLDSDRRGVINEFLDSFLEAAIDKITVIQKNSENELEAKFKENLQLLVDGQNLFMDNCHRLQSNERQIENDMVDILERILDRIDNKSKSESTTLEQIPKTLKTQSNLEEKMFAELSELIKTQSDQVTRTVAYSTNQVLKLHHDLTNISNALMTVHNGGGLSNVTVTTTDMNDRLPLHNTSNSHINNPSTSKNKSNNEKLSTTMPKQNRSPHD